MDFLTCVQSAAEAVAPSDAIVRLAPDDRLNLTEAVSVSIIDSDNELLALVIVKPSDDLAFLGPRLRGQLRRRAHSDPNVLGVE
jgi:hypothetical protein